MILYSVNMIYGLSHRSIPSHPEWFKAQTQGILMFIYLSDTVMKDLTLDIPKAMKTVY